MKFEKIYVAGENGLVGSNLVRYLNSKNYNLISTNSRTLDLRDSRRVKKFFSGNKPDCVLLVAAKHGGIGAYQKSPVTYLKDNVKIYTNVIESAYETGVTRLINIGASCVYKGEGGSILKEQDYDKSAVQKPTEPYGIAKLYGMKLCEYYNREKKTEFISLLPANLYGDGIGYELDFSSVLPSMVDRFHKAKLSNAKYAEIWGSGKARREFLHVTDLVRAVEILINMDNLEHTMFNIGSGEVVSINVLARMIAEIVGFEGEIINDLSKPEGADRGSLDCQRIRDLGWLPQIPLRTGLAELYKNRW